MVLEKRQKINSLLRSEDSGVVFLSSWLRKEGISTQLLNSYKKNSWFYPIGRGAWMRVGDKPTYQGGLVALQKQAKTHIHIGGRTALLLLGKAHYIELAPKQIILFGGHQEKLPKWFSKFDWGYEIVYFPTSFLPPTIGLKSIEQGPFSFLISCPTRALMECLYLSPKLYDLIECYEIMEGLDALHPKQVQKLLEVCSSVKVKRLFLYMAEKANHIWYRHLNLETINLGKGKRSLIKNGIYIPKYGITVPKILKNYV